MCFDLCAARITSDLFLFCLRVVKEREDLGCKLTRIQRVGSIQRTNFLENGLCLSRLVLSDISKRELQLYSNILAGMAGLLTKQLVDRQEQFDGFLEPRFVVERLRASQCALDIVLGGCALKKSCRYNDRYQSNDHNLPEHINLRFRLRESDLNGRIPCRHSISLSRKSWIL